MRDLKGIVESNIAARARSNVTEIAASLLQVILDLVEQENAAGVTHTTANTLLHELTFNASRLPEGHPTRRSAEGLVSAVIGNEFVKSIDPKAVGPTTYVPLAQPA